uniref:Gamma-soluble NSF attachment protein n=1 Tax=Sinocyclocheilus anshuiensis TaxID=1608454 RepID=A0A671S0S6_9TELE
TMAQKITEAHEHVAKAEKYLKTSFMKWKPDYDSAASEYAKAAVAFKSARQLEQAKDAYLQEAEAHTSNRSFFVLSQDMQRLPEAVQYIEKASVMYVENGTPDTAAMALDRAGKLMEPLDLAKAAHLYQQAAGVFENEERLRQAVELIGKASRLLVRQQKFDEAAESLQKEKNMYKEIENYPTCFKKTIAQVLVHLHRGDYVAAEKCVQESYSIPGFSGSEDCVAMEQLLQGYDDQDEELVSRVCTSPLLRYMDNDYAKLAISLKVPGGGKKKPAAAGDSGAAPPEEEEDEYAGGLC